MIIAMARSRVAYGVKTVYMVIKKKISQKISQKISRII